MEWLTELVKSALRLGRGFATPFLLFLIFSLVRLFRMHKSLLAAPPPVDVAYELELFRHLAKDPPTVIAAVAALLWYLAYLLAVYPSRLVGLVLQDLFHMYIAPYGLPTLTLLAVFLLSKKWKNLLAATAPVALASALWIYAYNLWIHPVRPTPTHKMGIWIAPLAGQELDPRYLELFQELSNASTNLPAYVGRTPKGVDQTSLDEQAKQCRRLGLQVGARGVVWVVVGEKQTFSYATFDYSQIPERWEMPWGNWVNLTELRDRPAEMMQFLLGASCMYEGEYANAIKYLDATQSSESPFERTLLLTYSRLQHARGGDAKELADLIAHSRDLVQKSGDSYHEAQANFLLGLAYSEAARFAEGNLVQHPEFHLQTQDQALAAAGQAFRAALAKLPADTFPIERGRVLLALGKTLVNLDVLVGDLEQRSREAQSILDQAQFFLNTEDTRLEFGLASEYLGMAWQGAAYFASGDTKRYMCSKAIGGFTIALGQFPEQRFPSLHGDLQDWLGTVYISLSNLEPQTSVARAIAAFGKEREIANQQGIQSMLISASSGICVIASSSDASDVLLDGEKSCAVARQGARGIDPIAYAEATRGLGQIKVKMVRTKLPLPGVDYPALLREARGAFRDALAVLGSLPQKPYVRGLQDLIRSDLEDVELEPTAKR